MAHPPKNKLLEYSKIDANVYIGTNACCRTHFDKMLTKVGITAEISLEEGNVDMPYGVDEYLWLPTKDHTAPSEKKLAVGIAALDALLKNGQKVYIHCKNGHGRSPTFYAAYLIVKRGMSVDQAVLHVANRRPKAHIEDSQRALLERLEKNRASYEALGKLLP